ncbi:MAG TPA: ATP synthase F1 subunit delta [Candidatus Moranbacteria bacterium]|nr:ATP synthase F1 subunit delta [Candidatus Moranbacteria bacterium]
MIDPETRLPARHGKFRMTNKRMKITATQYAKTLYEMTEKKSQKEIDNVMENFVKVLAKNNQLKFKKNIIAKFEEIYDRENGIVTAQVVSREKLESGMIKKITDFLKSKYKAKEVVVENKIDENIKGGIIIKVGDEVLDGSVINQLNNLKKMLVK